MRSSDLVGVARLLLIDATTSGHLWAERYDGSLEDIFALQDGVTHEIVTALAATNTYSRGRLKPERSDPRQYASRAPASTGRPRRTNAVTR